MGRKHITDVTVTGAMAGRVMTDGRRAIKLRNGERKELLRQQKIETAVAMFLDLNADHKWEDIARECGLSLMGLKDLTKDDEFIAVYNAHYAELGHDPRLRAAQAALTDLLGPAIRTLRDTMSDPFASSASKVKTALEIIKLNGIETPNPQGSDKKEMVEFLKNAGVNIGTMNITLPPEYVDKGVQDIIDAQVTEIQGRKELIDGKQKDG